MKRVHNFIVEGKKEVEKRYSATERLMKIKLAYNSTGLVMVYINFWVNTKPQQTVSV